MIDRQLVVEYENEPNDEEAVDREQRVKQPESS